jgi:RND family efflux transporter MFP subunit
MKDRKLTGKILYGAAALVIIAVAWKILSPGAVAVSNGRGSGPAVPVRLAEVLIGPVQEIVELTGSVHPQYQFNASSKNSGKLVKLSKRLGDRVEKGQVLAQLDETEYIQDALEAEANLKIAGASMAEAQYQLEIAGREFEKAKGLRDQGFSTDTEFKNTEAEYKTKQSRLNTAKAQVELRETSLRSAQINLGYTKIISPKAGLVSARFIDEGNYLTQNTAVLSIIGIDTVLVKTSVPEEIYPKISEGLEISAIVDAYKEKVFNGRINKIAPSFGSGSRSAEIEIIIPNKENLLKPGMFAKVKVIVTEKQSARMIPYSALVNLRGTDGVYVADKEKTTVKFVAVERGIRNNSSIEIVSPEINGSVVTLGQHLLSDGAKISVEKGETK